MTRRQTVWSVTLLATLALIAYWPPTLVDVSPAWERRLPAPTETAVPLGRPQRPPHPIEIYRPPGSN